jgi:hypothetical protein
LSINNLPDEVLLEIFDSFRQGVDPYDQKWKKEHLWLNLAHACAKWRAVVFASINRLDLSITVGPEKPGHIKTILSSPLPLSLDYRRTPDCQWEEDIAGITGSALWRMRTVLKHHTDRVREITFEGEWASFNKFFKMTNCTFSMLESLSLTFFSHVPNIPATFLRGPDLSDLHHLRRLSVKSIAFVAIFDFLLSATALTHLTLVVDTPFGVIPETSILACLQVMPCLLSLDMTLLARAVLPDPDTPSESSAPEDPQAVMYSYPEEVFIHPKLKRFHCNGDRQLITDFVRWFRAPSVEDIGFSSARPDYSLLYPNYHTT